MVVRGRIADRTRRWPFRRVAATFHSRCLLGRPAPLVDRGIYRSETVGVTPSLPSSLGDDLCGCEAELGREAAAGGEFVAAVCARGQRHEPLGPVDPDDVGLDSAAVSGRGCDRRQGVGAVPLFFPLLRAPA